MCKNMGALKKSKAKEQLTKSQNVHIGQKGAYWMKMCLLTELCLLKNEKSQLIGVFSWPIYGRLKISRF